VNTNLWKKAKDLFHRALELPLSERDAFLLSSGADPEALHEVRRLLAQHAESRSFL